jgi:hypothetical protein
LVFAILTVKFNENIFQFLPLENLELPHSRQQSTACAAPQLNPLWATKNCQEPTIVFDYPEQQLSPQIRAHGADISEIPNLRSQRIAVSALGFRWVSRDALNFYPANPIIMVKLIR